MRYYEKQLYHHGIPNQKWGERNGPPYPLSSRQKSSAEKAAEKEAKKRINKEKALKSGTATEVLKYKGELTLDELKDAYNRLDYESKLSKLSKEELSRGKKKAKDILKDAASVSSSMYDVVKSVDGIAKIVMKDNEGTKKNSKGKK